MHGIMIGILIVLLIQHSVLLQIYQTKII